ncbi:hypothetical protein ALP99_00781 [Pseudomonas syringae pv. tomato]|nr:hypothetical protein NB04_21155 [Pseudomonas syringae pv. tomato]RMQ67716.1 hypothetical protein ALP99_00781 [Pseudomonas syringae pv. tomato]
MDTGCEGRHGHDACVVDYDVGLAEFPPGEVGECLHVGCIGYIPRAETCRAALDFYVGGQRLQALGAPCSQHNVRAFGCPPSKDVSRVRQIV